jgi:hypothetical protein
MGGVAGSRALGNQLSNTPKCIGGYESIYSQAFADSKVHPKFPISILHMRTQHTRKIAMLGYN